MVQLKQKREKGVDALIYGDRLNNHYNSELYLHKIMLIPQFLVLPVNVSKAPPASHIENKINENVGILLSECFHPLIFYEISEA